jgi:NADH-quinone oxidoreductase subunit M
LNGFVGEFLILLGAFAEPAHRVATGIGATGVILGAAYLLWMFQKMMQGPLTNPANERLRDLTPREITVLVPLVAMMFVIGLFPNLFLSRFDQSVGLIVDHVHTAAGNVTTAETHRMPGTLLTAETQSAQSTALAAGARRIHRGAQDGQD